MSKNLKKLIALVLVLAVSVSTFAMFTAQGYSATINGWSGSINAAYTWFASGNITDAQKAATRNAIAAELKYQNEVLEFRIGTHDPDGGVVGGDGGTDWDMGSWGGMAIVEIENKVAGISDNVGNPWGEAGRYWGAVIAPFPSMAFTLKGNFAAKYPSSGNDPLLGNEFRAADGSTVQVMWNDYLRDDGSGVVVYNRFPGSSGGSDITNNMFRYAVANYNQRNKGARRDGSSYHAGYPVGETTTTTDRSITYQTLMGERGTAFIAAGTQTIKEGLLQGAYVIPDTIAETFLELGANVSECFAITGAPIGEAESGKQRFENGVVSTTKGFLKSNNEITSFTIGGDIPAAIDNEANTISVYVDSSVDLSNATPNIVLGDSDAKVTPAGAQDFTKPVKYTVKAQSGDSRTYTVTAYKLADTDISSFELFGVAADIDRETNTITALVDSSADLTKAQPAISTVGTGTTVSPASGATVDLSGSWEKGVTYKVTKGSDSSTYTVKVRNLSTDTSIVKFNIPAGSLKYQTLYGEVVGTVSGTTINLMYESHNSATSQVVADVELAAGATISPDPTDARSQSNATYTVTAEDGKTQTVYKVAVTIDPSGKIGPKEDLTLESNILGTTGFNSKHNQQLAIEAITAEYNNQRTNIGYDPGDPSGIIESWDNTFPIRQFFVNGSSTQTMLNGYNAAIMMDVPDGRAYTLKGQMISLWSGGSTTEDGTKIDWLFRQAGGPAVNEFQMDGATYQQFSYSYGKYGNGQGITMNGIGTIYSRQVEALKESYYYYQPDNSLEGDIPYAFRKAYEYANVLDHNPGIALDGNFNVIELDRMTDEVVRQIHTVDVKGRHIYETTQKQWKNFVMYQVFSGSGATDSTTRNSADKTVILKGGNINGIDHGGAIALFGDIKTMYEATEGEKTTLEFKDGNGGTGNVVDTVEYNLTLGTPKYYGLTDEGEYVMEFASDEIGEDADGNPIMITTEFYYTAPKDDPTKLTRHEGNRFSSNNRIASIEIEGAAEVVVMNNGDLVNPNADPEDEEALRYDTTAIAIRYPAGTNIDEDFLKEIKINSITLEDEEATITNPVIEEGSTDIPAIDCSATGKLVVTAENNSNRDYLLLIYEGDEGGEIKSHTFGAQDWGWWLIPPEVELVWSEGLIGYGEDGKPIYGTDPNANLKDANGNPLWVYEYGYYTDGIEDAAHWNKLDVPADWDPQDPVNGWAVYRVEHNLGVKIS